MFVPQLNNKCSPDNMILNISGFSAPFQINRIELKPCQRYKIRLIDLHAIFTEKADAGIYQICSNLIDRENGNSDRILAYIRLDRRQTSIDFTPTQIIWYKLRLHDFSSSDIKLKSITSDKEVLFSEFSCQFEITENGRI